MDETKNEGKEQTEDYGASEEPLFLAYGTEDEVGVLLRHILELRLSTIEESLATKSTRTDGYLGLNDIISCPARVVFHTQKHANTRLLVRFHDIVQDIVGRVVQGKSTKSKEGDVNITRTPILHSQPDKIGRREEEYGKLNPSDVEGKHILAEEKGSKRQADAIEKNEEERRKTTRIYS